MSAPEAANITPIAVAGHSLGEYSALVAAGDLEIALAHAPVEGQVHLLEGVERAAPDALHALHRIQVEHQGEIRQYPTRREHVQLAGK